MQEVKLTITKSWDNLEDFYNSDEMIKLWSGISGRKSQLRCLQKMHNQGDIVFKRGIAIDGNLYELYTAQGINRIAKVTTFTCLAFQKVNVCSVKNDKVKCLIDPMWGGVETKEVMQQMPEHIFFGNL